MPQSLSRVVIHVVFATKGRTPLLTAQVRPELYMGVARILTELNCLPIRVGGVSDHLHVLFALARTRTVAEVVEVIKVRSSRWLKLRNRRFAWQAGYGAFSVGEQQLAVVARYIERQEEHHRRLSFADELRRILRHHGVEFDERYLWD